MSSIQTLYIDASEEITAVIERLKSSHNSIVALVVPKGGTLIQSIVNLKLIRRAAQDAQKDIILVTTDKIGRNLATQVGIPVAHNEKEIPAVASGTTSNDEETNVIAGVRIHRYYAEDEANEPEEEAAPTAPVAPVIVPKELLQKKTEAPKPADVVTKTEAVPALTEPLTEPEAPAPESTTPEAPAVEEVSSDEHTETQPDVAEKVPKPTAAPSDTIIKRTSIDTVESMPVVEKPQKMAAPKKPVNRKLIAVLAFFLILLLVGIAGSYFILPKTKVTVTVAAQPYTADIPAVAALEGTAPLAAEMLHQESSASAPITATGTKDLGTTASGTATFYNYGSTSAQTVPAGTTVTAGGKSFVTQADTSVPGYTQKGIGSPLVPGSNSAAIVSAAPGADNNMTDATIAGSIANNGNLSGKLSASGGTTKQVTVLTEGDIAKAKAVAVKQLRDDLDKKMAAALEGKTFTFVENSDTYNQGDFTTDQAAGAEVSAATATLKGSLDRIVVDTTKVTEFGRNQVQSEATPTETRQVDTVTVNELSLNSDKTALSFKVHVEAKITPVFNPSSILTSLTGKEFKEASPIITAATSAKSVSITETPTWWPLKHFSYFTRFTTIEFIYE